MARLTFDEVGTREYQSGIDRAVIYFRDQEFAVWNGITSVEDSVEAQTLKSYFLDGVPFLHNVTPGFYEGAINAVTYPEEFLRAEGTQKLDKYFNYPGMSVTHQRPEPFHLTYRTGVGTDIDAHAGHKIHMIYNVTALPSNRVYQTLGGDPSASEFSWDIKAIPAPGFDFPTSHVIFDSRRANPWWMTFLENWLYGSDGEDPYFPSLPELIYNFSSVNAEGPSVLPVTVVDNFDGTWTATGSDGNISIVSGVFSITEVDGVVFGDGTYNLEVT